MLKNTRGSAAARLVPDAREQDFVIPRRPETYVANAPSLAADVHVAGDTLLLPGSGKQKVESPPRRAREVWFLVVWLAVSIAVISAAAGVIATYF